MDDFPHLRFGSLFYLSLLGWVLDTVEVALWSELKPANITELLFDQGDRRERVEPATGLVSAALLTCWS